MSCEICHIDERAPERDRLCSFGEPLRIAAVEEYRMAERKVAG